MSKQSILPCNRFNISGNLRVKSHFSCLKITLELSVLKQPSYLNCRNENFCGDDVIKASMTNKNGLHDTYVSVFVEPINDPPFIHVPKFSVISRKTNSHSSRIFDERRDDFEFLVGDPDVFCFPGTFIGCLDFFWLLY